MSTTDFGLVLSAFSAAAVLGRAIGTAVVAAFVRGLLF